MKFLISLWFLPVIIESPDEILAIQKIEFIALFCSKNVINISLL